MGSYSFPVKAAIRALTYFHDHQDNCVLVLANNEDGLIVSNYAITDSFVNIRNDECILYLCDGGIARAIESKNAYGQRFLKWRYVLTISGDIKNKLGRRKKWLSSESVSSPLVVGAASYLGRQVKSNVIDLSQKKVSPIVLENQREFKIRRCILYSRYLFLRSPKYKLFILGELRRSKIPITCICTDGDSQAIQMLKGSLKTDNIFGFTNETVNRFAKDTKTSLSVDYRIFKLEDSLSVPSLYSNALSNLNEAKRSIKIAKTANESDDLFARIRAMTLATVREFNNLRSCSLPPTLVKSLAPSMSQLRASSQSVAKVIHETVEAKCQNLFRAASSLNSALDIILAQIPSENKLFAVRRFLEENPTAKVIPWSRDEGEALSAAIGLDTIYVNNRDDFAVFGGLRSTWLLLEIIRRVHPARVKLVGWDVEAVEYDSFKHRYYEASDMLYNFDRELAVSISNNTGAPKTVK